MDLRDDTHTQLKDHIATLRYLSKLDPASPVVTEEMNRYFAQSATLLEIFILPTIKPATPYLDLRTGVLGNAHRIAPLVTPEVVGATSQEAAEADAAGVDAGTAFLPPSRNGEKVAR